MLGRTDGLRILDISAGGFWNSFYAIVVALPAFMVKWVSESAGFLVETHISRPSIVARLAVVDLAVWIVPLILLALVVRRVGLASRFVPFVVASNWGTTLIVWLTLPLSLTRLAIPELEGTIATLVLLFSLAAMVLGWRLTNASLGKGPGIATGLFAALYLVSLLILLGLQEILGLTMAPQPLG